MLIIISHYFIDFTCITDDDCNGRGTCNQPSSEGKEIALKKKFQANFLSFDLPSGVADSSVGGIFPNPRSGGCAETAWVSDAYCDDGNNNADCNFDGGDCCNNDAPNWDAYCTICECLGNHTSEYQTNKINDRNLFSIRRKTEKVVGMYIFSSFITNELKSLKLQISSMKTITFAHTRTPWLGL